MNLIDKYLGEGKGLRKTDIFNKVSKALTSDWWDIDKLSIETKLPITKRGLEAHMDELVKKGKVKWSMKKGKNVWMKK